MAVTDLGTLTREHAYALAALDACVAELERTPPGWRNNRLNAIAYRLGRMVGRGWIDRHIVVQRLTASCQGNRLAADDGEDSIRDPRIRLGGHSPNAINQTVGTRFSPPTGKKVAERPKKKAALRACSSLKVWARSEAS
jgi:hypothetical protein